MFTLINKDYPKIFFIITIVLFTIIISMNLSSQSIPDIDEDFINSLPPELIEDLDLINSEEAENEKLLRYDTSIEEKNSILKNLQDQIDRLRNQILEDEGIEDFDVQIFGSSFFNSAQTTFSPFDLANISDTYILGPGDVVELNILSSVENNLHELTINQKGTVLIPNIGEINISNFNIKDATLVINNFVKSKVIGSEVFLAVKEMKDIQIAIMGYIENPGIYTIAGNSNYLHALNVAGGISKSGSYREIHHIRDGVAINKFDLYPTFAFGLMNNLETIRAGDVIFVKPKKFMVTLTGGVSTQGIFEIKENEMLDNLIEYAGGFSEDSYGFDNLIIKRITNESTKIIRVPFESIETVRLFPRDSIVVPFIKTQAEKLMTVSITGSITNPGEYFIRDGESVSNLIKRSGGYKKDAYPFGAALFRESALKGEYEFAQRNYEETINFIVSNLGTPNTSIDASAVSLLSEELKSQKFTGRIVTEFNLSKIDRDPSVDIILQPGDRIVIPSLSNTVYMFGEYQNPSTLLYRPNLKLKDYIAMTGGMKDTAMKELIIIDPDGRTSVYKNNFLFNSDIAIYPGSIIYAPRNIGEIKGINYAATVSPILSSLALTIASLNSISN